MRGLTVFILAGLLIVPCAFAGFGTPTLDGAIAGGDGAIYGSPLATQNVDTSFGNANGSLLGGGGGELDRLYVAWDATTLYVLTTGNIEASGNILFVFIDNGNNAGGVTGAFAGISGGDGYFQGAGSGMGGSTFPTGMNVDFALAWKCFDDGGDSDLDWRYQTANLVAGTTAVFGNFDTSDGTNPVVDTSQTIDMAIDNSNAAGVGGTPPGLSGDPTTVTTGVELGIPFTQIPGTFTPSTSMQIFVAYCSGDGNFFSNQALPAPATPGSHLATDPNFSTANGGLTPAVFSTVPVELSVFSAN